MAEEKKTTEVKKPEAKKVVKKPMRRKFGPRKPFRRNEPADDFEQKIVDLARVTRVMGGGKRMKFRACMIVGDKKGKVGMGLAKGADVAMAIGKSVAKAKKEIIEVPIIEGTIPHEVNIKFKSAKIMIKPAKHGSGIKAGGVVRIILELAGIKDAVAKILGTNNKVNNAKATVMALNSFLPKAAKDAKPVKKEVKPVKKEIKK